MYSCYSGLARIQVKLRYWICWITPATWPYVCYFYSTAVLSVESVLISESAKASSKGCKILRRVAKFYATTTWSQVRLCQWALHNQVIVSLQRQEIDASVGVVERASHQKKNSRSITSSSSSSWCYCCSRVRLGVVSAAELLPVLVFCSGCRYYSVVFLQASVVSCFSISFRRRRE